MARSDVAEARLRELLELARKDPDGATRSLRQVASEMFSFYAGDVRSFVARHLDRSFRRLGPSLVDDVCGATWEAVPVALAQFKGDSSFRTWLLSIATKKALNEVRRAKYRDVQALSDAVSRVLPRSQGLSAKLERAEPVRRAFEALDEDERGLLERCFDGLTAAEIARELEVGIDAAEARISRTKRKFRKLLREAAGE